MSESSAVWYEIRDLFFGQNRSMTNVGKALAIAAQNTSISDAKWLCEVFADRGADLELYEVVALFRSRGNDDARALCFAAEIDQDETLLRQSANLGYGFAQALLAEKVTDDEESFGWAQKAAVQGERNAFCSLGDCYRNGRGCELSIAKAKQNYEIAANLGHIDAMSNLGALFDDSDLQRWYWFGKAAARGQEYSLVGSFAAQVEKFNNGFGDPAVVFAIGKALKQLVNMQTRKFLNGYYNGVFPSHISPANQAIDFYEEQVMKARKAVDAWTFVGIRLHIVKDVRKMIGEMIWAGRADGEYED